MRRPVHCAVCLALLLFSGFASGSLSGASAVQADETWTILAYMAADGDSNLPWQDDINEMEAAGESTRVDVLVLVDPDGPGNSMILHIAHDENISDPVIVSTEIDDAGAVISGGEVNTGSPTTLQDFIEFGVSEYPADRYVLLLWGHGGGWWGLCPDGMDLLTLQELDSALDGATQNIGRDLDMVIVDACAEAVVETMYQIREHAGWLVASERGVPIQGLPYRSILDRLASDPGISVPELGRVICDEYADWAWFYSSYSVSMGLFDLDAVGRLAVFLGELSTQGLRFERLFHDSLYASYVTGEGYEMESYLDLGDFLLELLARDLPLELHWLAMEVLFAYDEVVEYLRVYSNPDPVDGVKMPDATGAVIYFPSSDSYDSSYALLEFAYTSWDRFAVAVREGPPSEPSGPGPEISYADSDGDGLSDSAALVWAGDYSSVSVWVFRDGLNGLTLERLLNSSSNWVQIQGLIGSLVVGACADVDGVSVSYRVLNVSLMGLVQVRVILDHLGEPLVDGYVLDLVTSSGVHAFDARQSDFVCTLEVPTSAEVGEVVLILVKASKDGTTVSEAWAALVESGTTVRVHLFLGEEEGLSVPLLVLSILPAGVIFLAAGALAIRSPRTRAPPRTSS